MMLMKSKRKWKGPKLWFLCAVMLVGLPLASQADKAMAAATELYASPSGTGTVCSSAAPCSLTGARDQARLLTAGMTGNVIVNLSGGTYYLGSTFTLGTQDSGTNGYAVIYRKKPGETNEPIISGGQEIPGSSWVVHDSAQNIYKANVGSLNFRQLYVADSRAIRARQPNLTNENTGGPYYSAVTSVSPFKVNVSEIGTWAESGHVEFVWNAHWRHKRLIISDFTVSGTQAELSMVAPPPMELNSGIINNNPQDPTYYYFENALELLDAPGEWFLDKSTANNHMLYYKPRTGESMASVKVIAPKVQTLVSIQGTDSATPAHHIQLKGITFAHSNWTHPSLYGYLQTQAGLPKTTSEGQIVPGAIFMMHTSHIRFEQNTVHSTGAIGMLMKGALQFNQIVSNTFRDIAAGGIYSYSQDSSYDLISNNLVEKVGRDYKDGVGILATKPDHMSIEFNEVRTMPYTGINLGWQWDDTETGTDDNTVQYNKIYDVMQLLDDGGGIYTLGRTNNTTFHHNYIYNLTASSYLSATKPYPIAGIYLDGGSAYKTVQENVLDNTTVAFFANNPPNHDNLIQNNYHNVPQGTILNTNQVINNTLVSGSNWPPTAADIISKAGRMTNQTLAYTAVSASSSSSGYSPNLAVNDSTDEPGWKPNLSVTGNPWWQIDLGTAARIKKIEIVSRLGTANDPVIRRNFQIWASNNAAMSNGYVVLATVDSNGFPHQTTWSRIITDQASYRYVAIVKTGQEDFYLNEVRIYR
ncbi:right-handed parallel beta-helix repeat-containing protein [Paenibacillus silviterrae]|uniref:right-handed parallel beta-helix repeat-containing protein n=1 Tax=Paenibacillus silviterrae TaxID=3242194 RepID=UPI002543CE27|nr:right-handed parallel beta-helix repeat-containing protein [Paenibacillus chinjuensis]